MQSNYEPTTEELKAVWMQAGLWRGGHTFEQDIKVGCIHQTLRNAVLAKHKKAALPQQRALNLEVAV